MNRHAGLVRYRSSQRSPRTFRLAGRHSRSQLSHASTNASETRRRRKSPWLGSLPNRPTSTGLSPVAHRSGSPAAQTRSCAAPELTPTARDKRIRASALTFRWSSPRDGIATEDRAGDAVGVGLRRQRLVDHVKPRPRARRNRRHCSGAATRSSNVAKATPAFSGPGQTAGRRASAPVSRRTLAVDVDVESGRSGVELRQPDSRTRFPASSRPE